MSQAAKKKPQDDDPITRLLRGEALALARAITAVENQNEAASDILFAIQDHLGRALVVGFTGPPGAGKSTLVNAYISELRKRGQSVGVIAVDPSSPISGGAILGDRIRMTDHATDTEVFVRSLAARGHLGGLTRTTAQVIDVMDAAGKDVIVVETVGAGQSEVEVAEVADVKIVVCAPGLGDDIQAIKAGILEIADILVVNKSDLPLADHAAGQLKSMLGLRDHGAPEVPVISTTATSGEGVTEMTDAIEAHGSRAPHGARRADPRQRMRRLIATAAARLVQEHVRGATDTRLDEICDLVQRGELDFDSAARRLLAEGLAAPDEKGEDR